MSIAEDNNVQETPAKSSVSDVLSCNTNKYKHFYF